MKSLVNSLVLFAAATAAAAPYPVPKHGVCSGNFYESGGYCVPMNDKAKQIIPKGNRPCPSGWSSGANYCEKM